MDIKDISSSKQDIDSKTQIELKSEEFQDILGSMPPWIQRRGIVVIGIILFTVLIGSVAFKYPDKIEFSPKIQRVYRRFQKQLVYGIAKAG